MSLQVVKSAAAQVKTLLTLVRAAVAFELAEIIAALMLGDASAATKPVLIYPQRACARTRVRRACESRSSSQ
jgi:hypothetical protein